MRRFFYYVTTSLLMFALVSCSEDPDFKLKDFDDLDKEITLFSKGLEVPLGSSGQFCVDSLLGAVNDSSITEFLQKDGDGNYSFSYSGNYDLGDELKSLEIESVASLDAVDITQDFSFKIGDIEDDLSIEGIDNSSTAALDKIDLDNVNLPEISASPDPIKPGISGYMPETFDLNVDPIGFEFDLYDVNKNCRLEAGGTQSTIINVARVISLGDPDKELEFGDYLNFSNLDIVDWGDSHEIDESIELDMNDSADGLAGIGNIKIKSGAKMKAVLTVNNPLFTKGVITTDCSLDFGTVFQFTTGDGIIDFSDLQISSEEGWTDSKTYTLASINQDAISFDSENNKLVVAMNAAAPQNGKVYVIDAYTTVSHLESVDGAMSMSLTFVFEDFEIESFDMEVEDLHYDVDDINIPVTFSAELPDVVSSINAITFNESKPVTLEISATNISGITAADGGHLSIVPDLVVTFPAGLRVKDADANNSISISGDLSEGPLKKDIIIEGLKPVCSGGKVSFDGNIVCKMSASASGKFNTSKLPKTEAQDVVVSASVKGTPEVEDFDISLNPDEIAGNLSIDEQVEFSFDLDGFDDFGSFNVVPDGQVVTEIKLGMPKTTEVDILGNNLRIHLPEMMIVDASGISGLSGDNSFDSETNDIVISGKLPQTILLPVTGFDITPVAGEDGKITSTDVFSIKGALNLSKYEITKKTIDEISGAEITMSGKIPGFKVKSITLDGDFSKSISEEMEAVTILDEEMLKSFPSELKKIRNIDFDKTSIMMEINVTGLPDFGGDIYLKNAKLVLPEMIVMESGSNVVELEDLVLQNGKPAIVSPKAIRGIKDVNLDGVKEVTGGFSFSGEIFAANPEVDVATLKSEASAAIKVVIGNGKSSVDPGKIAVSKVVGNIDYAIEEDVAVSLEDIPDNLKDINLAVNPLLRIDLASNLGFPVVGDIELIPFPYKENTITLKGIELPYSDKADVVSTKSYAIGRDAVQTGDIKVYKENLSKLISHVPDSIVIKVKAPISPDTDCIFFPSVEYKFNVAYDLNVPLLFEKEASIPVATPEFDLDSEIADILTMTPFEFKADFVSTLPLKLNAQVSLLDADGKALELDKPCGLEIAASDGSECVSPIAFQISIKDKKAVPAKVSIQIDAAFAEGVCLNASSYVQVKNVSLVLPEGITVDIDSKE